MIEPTMNIYYLLLLEFPIKIRIYTIIGRLRVMKKFRGISRFLLIGISQHADQAEVNQEINKKPSVFELHPNC